MSFIPHTPEQRARMLAACGVASIDDLFADIPESLKPRSFDLGRACSEMEVRAAMRRLEERNRSRLVVFLGGGFYDHHIPAAVDALCGRSEFVTAYTPYQPEISQGTLQAIYEWQSQVCRLTGMDVANASLYDGGTALCEACQVARGATGRRRVVVDGGLNPVYRKMLTSYTANLDIAFHEVPVRHGRSDRDGLREALDDDTACLILQNPNFFGAVDDHSDLAALCRARGILTIQSVYPIALAWLKTPGEQGIDIATAEGQSLGNPLAFGGPYLGIMAVRQALVRRLPGRLVGRTLDRRGREAFVLTLQAREQHIRRAKATSNICTNQALCALRAHAYLSLVGREGLKQVADLCYQKAQYAKARLKRIPGVEVMESSPTFNEFTVRLPMDAAAVAGAMVERGIAPGLPLGCHHPDMSRYLLVAVTEKRTRYEIGLLAETLEAVLAQREGDGT